MTSWFFLTSFLLTVFFWVFMDAGTVVSVVSRWVIFFNHRTPPSLGRQAQNAAKTGFLHSYLPSDMLGSSGPQTPAPLLPPF